MKDANIRIGDKVKIKSDLRKYWEIGKVSKEMMRLAGQILEVLDISRPNCFKSDWGYRLNDTGEKARWTEDLFEKVVEYNEQYDKNDFNITFPCWPGETLYVISGSSIIEFCTTSFEVTDRISTGYGKGEILIHGYEKENGLQQVIDFQRKDMGKTVFLRKEAAIHYLNRDKRLDNYKTDETVRIGNRDYIVFEHTDDGRTLLVTKEFYLKNVVFDNDSPDYKPSSIRKRLQPLYEELKAIVGEENIIKHTVDLTTHDGRKDFGSCEDYISLPTFDFVRNHIETFDKYKDCVDDYGWLANAWSTPETGWEYSVCVLSSIGYLDRNDCCDHNGARAFCILKSDTVISGKSF